jgi:HEAT repeat protein
LLVKKISNTRLFGVGACVLVFLLLILLIPLSLREPMLETATKASLGDTNALAALHKQGPEVLPILVGLLEYHEPLFRKAIRSLTSNLPKPIARKILRHVQPIDPSAVRATAAKAIGLLGAEAEVAVPDLSRRLRDPEPYVALEAAKAMARIGSCSVPKLTVALNDTNPVVRRAAAYGLGELGSGIDSATATLIMALGDSDRAVRGAAAFSLSTVGSPTIKALTNLVSHEDPALRDAAITQFIHLYRDLHGMVGPLIELSRVADVSTRVKAIEGLAMIRATDEASIQVYMQALSDPAVNVRLAGIKALSMISWKLDFAVPNLSKSLSDPEPPVREAAAKLLAGLSAAGNHSREALRQCLLENDGSVRAAAQQALKQFENVEVTGHPVSK